MAYTPGGPVFNKKQKDAMAWPLANVTGSLQFTDGDTVSDASGHVRISFTDAGSTLLKNATGVTGYTLNTSNHTTIAGNLEVQGNIGFYDKAPVAQASAITALVDNSGGTATPGGTIAEIENIALSTGDAYTDTAVNDAVNAVVDDCANAIEELSAKVNAITLALRNLGLIA